ncbi:MAG: hypothetical protein ACUVXG_04880, partial [Anaerolineae bacterium]
TGLRSRVQAFESPRGYWKSESRFDTCKKVWYNNINLMAGEPVQMLLSLSVAVIILVLVVLLVEEPIPFGASQ